MRLPRLWALGFPGCLLAAFACSSANNPDTGLGSSTTTGTGAGGKGASGHSGSTGGTGLAVGGPGTGGATTTGHGGGLNIDAGMPTMMSDCPSMPDVDQDGDGWTANQGDCNDCDKNVNPGAVDVVSVDMAGNPLPADKQVDSNCDGVKATAGAKTSCDEDIAIGGVGDPFDAARAMGLCNVKVEADPADPKQRVWGVTQATLSDIIGAPFASPPPAWNGSGSDVGILDGFGGATHPQEGGRVFSLSSGVARAPGQPGYKSFKCSTSGSIDKGYPGPLSKSYPDGFPKPSSCGMTGGAHDGIALDLEIRVPTNAHAMSFDFRFFTCEYPVYVCQSFNDILAVFMAPDPLPAGDPMGNASNTAADIAFESSSGMKNTIGVNNTTFLTACDPGPPMYNACKGSGDLDGTNFEGHAASAWLRSQVPVPPGQKIILRIAIWDSGDGLLDSTSVIDNFQWIADPGANNGTTTTIIPDPHLRKSEFFADTGDLASGRAHVPEYAPRGRRRPRLVSAKALRFPVAVQMS